MIADIHINSILLHLANVRFGDYYAGMFHLLSGIEYVLPLIATGLFIGQQKKAIARKMIIAFVIALFLGVIVGYSLFEYEIFSLLCVIGFIVVGILLAVKRIHSLIFGLAVSIVLGILLGLPNGAAWQSGVSPVNYMAGILTTGGIIVLLLAGLVVAVEKKWQIITVRVVGSWIAAIGIMYIPYILMN